MIELFSLAAMSALGLASDLPNDEAMLRYKPSSNVYIEDQNGAPMLTLGRQNREWVDLADMPQVILDAVLSAEDKNFWLHDGLDGRALARAAVQNITKTASGQRLIGGSTISQQLSKLAFVGSDRSLKRKVREVMVAKRFERIAGKPRVLELYLNEIYLGRGVYGVAKAADAWFDKPLNDLKPEEAATLASLIKAPGTFSRERNRERLTQRRNWVLKEMQENGYLSADERARAKATPIQFTAPKKRNHSLDTYYEDAVRRDLVNLLGEARVREGGLRVTVDRDQTLQAQVEKSLSTALSSIDSIYPFTGTWKQKKKDPKQLKSWTLAKVTRVNLDTVDFSLPNGRSCKMSPYQTGNHKVQGSLGRLFRTGEVAYVATTEFGSCFLRQVPEVSGAVVALNSRTGAVIATAGGYDYSVSKFNRAQQAFRQPGSTIKPLTYAAAFNDGWFPSDIIEDSPVEIELPGDRIWSPTNADNKFHGNIQLEEGLYRSRNVPTLKLAQEVGFSKIWRTAEHIGLADTMPREWTITLGSAETTVTKMGGAYASLLNAGHVSLPTTIRQITDLKGNVIFDPDQYFCSECIATSEFATRMNAVAKSRTQITPQASAQLKSSLRKVLTQGTARSVGRGLPADVIGKTGTTNFYRDAWFVGETQSLGTDPVILAIYVGYDRPKPIARGATGGRVAGPIFRDIVLSVMNGETFKKDVLPRASKSSSHFYVSSALNMRSRKTTKSRVLQIVPKNKRLSNVSCSGGWCKATYAGKTGFLAKRFVRKSSGEIVVAKVPDDRFTNLRNFMASSGGTYQPNYEDSSTLLASSEEYQQRLRDREKQTAVEAAKKTRKVTSTSSKSKASKSKASKKKRKVSFRSADSVLRSGGKVPSLKKPVFKKQPVKSVKQPTNTNRKKKRRCKMRDIGGDMVEVCYNY